MVLDIGSSNVKSSSYKWIGRRALDIWWFVGDSTAGAVVVWQNFSQVKSRGGKTTAKKLVTRVELGTKYYDQVLCYAYGTPVILLIPGKNLYLSCLKVYM